jgi:hypothetical protein
MSIEKIITAIITLTAVTIATAIAAVILWASCALASGQEKQAPEPTESQKLSPEEDAVLKAIREKNLKDAPKRPNQLSKAEYDQWVLDRQKEFDELVKELPASTRKHALIKRGVLRVDRKDSFLDPQIFGYCLDVRADRENDKPREIYVLAAIEPKIVDLLHHASIIDGHSAIVDVSGYMVYRTGNTASGIMIVEKVHSIKVSRY